MLSSRGPTKGLGAGIALALAQAGANVACHGRSATQDGIVAAIQNCGRRSFYISGDVSDPAVCERIVEATVKEFGCIEYSGQQRRHYKVRARHRVFPDGLE